MDTDWVAAHQGQSIGQGIELFPRLVRLHHGDLCPGAVHTHHTRPAEAHLTATVVRRAYATAALVPQVSVAIAVDTAYVAARAQDGYITSGVFMMDNMVHNGSAGEGTLALETVCNAGSLIGFQVIPIDAEGSQGDQVVITSFVDVRGNVFTGAGHPIQQPPIGNLPPGSYWIGQALAAGTEVYQIQIEVTVGQLQPVRYFVWWTATLKAS